MGAHLVKDERVSDYGKWVNAPRDGLKNLRPLDVSDDPWDRKRFRCELKAFKDFPAVILCGTDLWMMTRMVSASALAIKGFVYSRFIPVDLQRPIRMTGGM